MGAPSIVRTVRGQLNYIKRHVTNHIYIERKKTALSASYYYDVKRKNKLADKL